MRRRSNVAAMLWMVIAWGLGLWMSAAVLQSEPHLDHSPGPAHTAFPAFNNTILDAVRQWQFEPFVVESQARPICMTVSVNINWR